MFLAVRIVQNRHEPACLMSESPTGQTPVANHFTARPIGSSSEPSQ
jgi:hypothetical protein